MNAVNNNQIKKGFGFGLQKPTTNNNAHLLMFKTEMCFVQDQIVTTTPATWLDVFLNTKSRSLLKR
jgi:hypothetical protein